MKRSAVTAISMCIIAGLFYMFPVVSHAQERPFEEIEAEVIALIDQLSSAAGMDWNLLSSLYAENYDEQLMIADYEADWSCYTGRDQHFATVICAKEPYYAVDISSAICSGYYPNIHYELSDWDYLFKDTEDGLKICDDTEGVEQISEKMYELLPSGALEADESGRNASEFNSNVYWFVPGDRTVNGALVEMIRYAWQDEDGNLCFSFILANGTGGNRSFSSFRITMTDSELGTVYEGDVTDKVVNGSFSVMDGACQMVTCRIDSSQVQTGTQKWGSLNVNIHHTNI